MTPPAFKGGQGRTARQIRSDGKSCGWLFLILVCMVLLATCAS